MNNDEYENYEYMEKVRLPIFFFFINTIFYFLNIQMLKKNFKTDVDLDQPLDDNTNYLRPYLTNKNVNKNVRTMKMVNQKKKGNRKEGGAVGYLYPPAFRCIEYTPRTPWHPPALDCTPCTPSRPLVLHRAHLDSSALNWAHPVSVLPTWPLLPSLLLLLL